MAGVQSVEPSPTSSAARSSSSAPPAACCRTGCPPGPARRPPTRSWRWPSRSPRACGSPSAPAATSSSSTPCRTSVAYAGAPPRPTASTTSSSTGAWSPSAARERRRRADVDMRTGAAEVQDGPVGTVRFAGLPGGEKDVESGCRTTRPPSWSRCGRTPRSSRCRRRRPPHLAAPRQLDQPRLRTPRARPAPGPRWPPPRGGVDLVNLGLRRQRAARPVHRPRDARHPGRPDQRQDRHQPRQHRPDAAARLRPGGARLPRHDPRGPPDDAAARRLADALPDPRGHARPGALPTSRLAEGRLRFRADRRPGARSPPGG